ncbi:4-coumarate-CoA ligase [Basidiobolus meristosporus CBS 931.73]|uniref:4-coumarate-CoA ligase n=1 Tax=Basidiobolus meristosporus CBS 931.73 TaxID=1314790 RepID=A0A1Y1YQ12_9FUNG|nr:4-coumarate-CoA ligase [Basidiobolus meristosporus CBS 931.73]|eukprot:ORY00069.1 4-coumarate-CoA ligase [Basidiobolus meristosporus CBS 931.73]
MLYSSPYAPVDIPDIDVFTYLFDNPPPYVTKESVVIIDSKTNQKTTFGQLQKQSLAFAKEAERIGVGKGDVVAVFSGNNCLYSSVCFGTIAIGGIVAPFNPSLKPAETCGYFSQLLPKVVVTEAQHLPKIQQTLELSHLETTHIYVFDSHEQAKSILDLEYDASFERPAVSPLDVAYICYSSGTSGLPKGVQLTHRNIVSNVAQQLGPFEQPERRDVYIGVLPFYHSFGLNCLLHMLLKLNATLVVMAKFEFLSFLRAIEEYQVTIARIAPPIAVLLSKRREVDDFDLSSLRALRCGAAPLGPGVSTDLARKLPHCDMKQGYGLTEAAPVITYMGDSTVVMGSVGHLLPNQVACIKSPSGHSLGVDQEGELWIKGPNVMHGYHNNLDATAATVDADGFLHTGDVAKFDKHGNLFITDRLKELIKYNGYQVAPAELEALLLTHPYVADAGVIGVQCPRRYTEIPKAFVVLKPEATPSEEARLDILQYVADRVANYKWIRGGVEFVSVIPKSPSGKLLRRELRHREKKRQTHSKL